MQALTRERRWLFRQGVRYLRFYSPFPGSITDLTHSGMGVETVAEMIVGTEYEFRIRHLSKVVSIAGDVRWSCHEATLCSSEAGELSVYRAGLRFRHRLSEKEMLWLRSTLTNRDRV